VASDPKTILAMLKKRGAEMRAGMPDTMAGFSGTFQAAEKDGVLSHKMKEFITLGIGIAIRCDFCIAAHLEACLKAGATREEIMEVCGVAIAMGGGPSYTYSALVLEFWDALQAKE